MRTCVKTDLRRNRDYMYGGVQATEIGTRQLRYPDSGRHIYAASRLGPISIPTLHWRAFNLFNKVTRC